MSVRESRRVMSWGIIPGWQALRLGELSKCRKVAFRRSIASDDLIHASRRALLGWLTARSSKQTISVRRLTLLLLRWVICAKTMLKDG